MSTRRWYSSSSSSVVALSFDAAAGAAARGVRPFPSFAFFSPLSPLSSCASIRISTTPVALEAWRDSRSTKTGRARGMRLGMPHFCIICEALMASDGPGTDRQARLARILGVLGAAHLRFRRSRSPLPPHRSRQPRTGCPSGLRCLARIPHHRPAVPAARALPPYPIAAANPSIASSSIIWSFCATQFP